MKENKWKVFGKGVIVGSTMIVPGVSGGTMAIVLGIYDGLLDAIASFRQSPKNNLVFLSVFSGGGMIGLLLLSTPLSWLLENYTNPTICFFIGAVMGSVPTIAKESGVEKIGFKNIVQLLVGVALVLGISKMPAVFTSDEQFFGISSMMLLFAAGVVSSVALILPGISFSHFLLLLGLYDGLLKGIRSMDFYFLFLLAAGVLAGVFLFSRILNTLMKKYPTPVYLIILGFMIGSIAQIFPEIRLKPELLVCLFAAVIGFRCVYRESR